MIVYISGPISNNPNYLIDFADAQRELEARGHEVINPAMLSQFFPKRITDNAAPGSLEYESILNVEAEIIRQMADRIALLPGWENSRGSKHEKQVAERESIPVWYPGGYDDSIRTARIIRKVHDRTANGCSFSDTCSECGENIGYCEKMNFCPVCGARFIGRSETE